MRMYRSHLDRWSRGDWKLFQELLRTLRAGAEVAVAQPAPRYGAEGGEAEAVLPGISQHARLRPPVEQRVLHLVCHERQAHVDELPQVSHIEVARRHVLEQALPLQRDEVARGLDEPAV